MIVRRVQDLACRPKWNVDVGCEEEKKFEKTNSFLDYARKVAGRSVPRFSISRSQRGQGTATDESSRG